MGGPSMYAFRMKKCWTNESDKNEHLERNRVKSTTILKNLLDASLRCIKIFANF